MRRDATRTIRDTAAVNRAVVLACRPRPAIDPADRADYWEDVEPQVAGAVRKRVEESRALASAA